MTVERITVLGGGTMGNGIAHVCAQAGRRVTLVDMNQDLLERALGTIFKNMDRQVKKEFISAGEKEAAMERISTATSVEEAVSEAQLVVEAVPETLELKEKIFKELDEEAPEDAILATNTSSISITEIAAFTKRPEKVIGMHFMNPVPMMKLVEVIRGLATDDETTQTVMELSKELGKTPVEVNDFPGFVSNRVLMPMINEAIFALMEGVAEAEAIDTVMKLGMAHPMGPLALADLIGLDVCLSILEVLHRDIGDDRYRPCPLLRKYVSAGWLGRKSGQGFFSYAK
jgi:3-hydroxybutyryl-CoA dehydrogenase